MQQLAEAFTADGDRTQALRTVIHPDMSEWEWEAALDEHLEDLQGFIAHCNREAARAEAINALRRREGRTIGAKRRAYLEQLQHETEHHAKCFAQLYGPPPAARVKARLERERSRRSLG